MLTLSFRGTDAAAVAAMRAKGPRIIQMLRTKLNGLMLQLSSYIVTQKLSGQVLKHRTGILAGSVNARLAEIVGTRMTAGVEAGGGPAFYGALNELGGRGAYQILAVKARALAFVSGGKQRFAKSVMHPPLPARPFMSTSLDEWKSRIEEELRQAVADAIEE